MPDALETALEQMYEGGDEGIDTSDAYSEGFPGIPASEVSSVHRRIIERFDDVKRLRRGRELTWYLNLAHYLGDQYASIDSKHLRILTGLENDKQPDHRRRIVLNKIKPAADHLVDLLVRGRPTLQASPSTSSPDDIDAAQVASSALLHEWKRMDLTLLDHDIRLWKAITGTCGFWSRWNESEGRVVNKEGGSYITGEIEGLVCSPFTLYPDERCGTRLKQMRFYIHATKQDVELLREVFPHAASRIASDTAIRGLADQYESKLRQMHGATLGGGYDVSHADNAATLLTYWEPRSRKHPDGVMGICTVNAMLWMGPNPWAHFPRWCPIVTFRHTALSDSYWGKGPVEDAIGPQKERNKTMSQIVEHRDLTTRGRYWVPKGCQVDINQLTGEPSGFVYYTPVPETVARGTKAYRPEREDPPMFPQGHYKMLDQLQREIEDIFMFHPVSQAQAPGGLRAGVAIRALQEKDESPSLAVAERDNHAWMMVGRFILQLIHDHWSDERVIEVRGEDGHAELRAFRGIDIPASMNVSVDSDILLPTTRDARLQALIVMGQNGLLPPDVVQEAIFGGWGTIRTASEMVLLHERKQRRENARMQAGEMIPVKNYDDHLKHLKVINNFRATAQFDSIEALPTQIPRGVGPSGEVVTFTVGDIFEAHAQQHGIALMQMGPQGLLGMTGLDALATASDGEPRGADAQQPKTGSVPAMDPGKER